MKKRVPYKTVMADKCDEQAEKAFCLPSTEWRFNMVLRYIFRRPKWLQHWAFLRIQTKQKELLFWVSAHARDRTGRTSQKKWLTTFGPQKGKQKVKVVSIYMCICVYVRMNVWIYIYRHTYIHMYIYTLTNIYIYGFVLLKYVKEKWWRLSWQSYLKN